MLLAYRALAKRVDAALPRLFSTLPRLPYGVEPVPPHEEKSAPAAFYSGDTLEGGRPGRFFGEAEVEIDRYLVMPGQALSYKVGELKLKKLRSLAARELGARFDVRAFRATVLGAGPLPLDVLEGRVRAWVEARKGAGDGPGGPG
jgi:uncharacterized protein (DUF885 family)